jgi:hypothetical protein
LDYSSILKIEAKCSSETTGDFQRAHGVTSEKTELCIATTVRNPKYARIIACFEKKTSKRKRLILCSYTTKMTGTKYNEVRENIARNSFIFVPFSD